MAEKERKKPLSQEEADALRDMDSRAAFLRNPQNQTSEAFALAARQRGESLLKAATAGRIAGHSELDETS